jgi:glycosyltransferase involved in cell wall biosynthesis
MDANPDFTPFEALRGLGPQVVTNSQVLESEEYLEWLQKADLVLLPYNPEVYRSRGSGVFFEAARLGIPAIVTADCAFAQEAFARRRAVPIERYDSDGVADAILKAVRGLGPLTERARAAALAGTVAKSDATRTALELLAARIRDAKGSTAKGRSTDH